MNNIKVIENDVKDMNNRKYESFLFDRTGKHVKLDFPNVLVDNKKLNK